MKNKKVYIFGNEKIGYQGYTYDKGIAEGVCKNRKHLNCVKIKNDEDLNFEYGENYITLGDDLFMTESEEIYYCEAFSQYQLDAAFYSNSLLKSIKYFNFTDDEKSIIKYLISFLLYYNNLIETGEYLAEDVFDNNKTIKYFINEVLDG